MAFTKIENTDIADKGVIGLPNKPNMSASDIQHKFDELALDVIVPKHNALIDELEAGEAGASIGVKDANDNDTTLQARLDDIAAGGYTKTEADETFLKIDTAEETYLSQEDAASTYLSLEDASDDYLTKSDASDTYLTQTSAEDTYLSQSDASDTYLTKTDASSDYLTKTDAASEYLTQDSASGTYLTKTDASDDYLAKTDASTTYLSKTDASSTYVAKETGKGLSTNDYNDTEKNKLAGIEAGANNYVLPVGNLTVLGGVKADGVTFNIDENGVGHAAGGGGSLDYGDLSNKPQINGITLAGDKSPSELEIALPQLYDTEITSPSDGQIIQYDGTDQVWKNVNYQAQAQADWNESDSTAPDYIKNKPTIPDAQIQSDWNQSDNTAKDFIKNKPNLATVATSGSYDDLSNKPTIPASQVNADWNASSGVAEILNKPTIPDVSTKMNTDGSNAASEVAFNGAVTVGTRGSGTVGTRSFAQGISVIASGNYSHASGANTVASGTYSHVSGCNVTADIMAQFVHGNNNSSYRKFRGITVSEPAGACFGFGMNSGDYTSDASITNGGNGCNGTIENTATVSITLKRQAMYLLIVSAYTLSSGAVYGSAVYLITCALKDSDTPNSLAIKTSTNAPATISVDTNSKLKIKNGATSRATQFQLLRIN